MYIIYIRYIENSDHEKTDVYSLVGCDCRIQQLLSQQRGKTPSSNEFPTYDTKQSDGEARVMLEFWVVQSTPALPSLAGPLWTRVITPDRFPINVSNRTYRHLN